MSEQHVIPTESITKPLLQRTWFALFVGAAFGAILIFADQFGFAGNAEWAVIFIASIAIASSLFWGKRSRPWFWPSLALLVIAHAVLLTYWKWDVVPAPGAINIKGAVALDTGLNVLWLFWMGWLFDPRQKPRTTASKTVEIVLYGMVIVILGIVAFLSWAVQRKHDQKLALAKVVIEKTVPTSLEELTWCITPDAKAHGAWQDVPSVRPSKRIYDYVYDIGTIITDNGQNRVVIVTTIRGKPLGKRQAVKFAECLGT